MYLSPCKNVFKKSQFKKWEALNVCCIILPKVEITIPRVTSDLLMFDPSVILSLE